MVYKYTNVKAVIAKVFTDLDLKEEGHRITDFISWTGEAMEKIGAFPALLTKVTGRDKEPSLILSNYQCRLPNGFHRLVQLAYGQYENGPWYPMRRSTGSFDYGTPNPSTETTLDFVASTNDLISLCMTVYDITYAAAVTKLNTEPETKSLLTQLAKTSTTNYAEGGEIDTLDYTYVIQGGYIKSNVENGFLMLSYQCIPTDINGYPMIPDDVSFMEAIYWYIVMKLYYPKWVAGQIRDAVYFEARRSWNFYCKQAYGNAMMPDADELQSIKNSWLRLIPTINEHDTFFTTLGERQIVYNQNN